MIVTFFLLQFLRPINYPGVSSHSHPPPSSLSICLSLFILCSYFHSPFFQTDLFLVLFCSIQRESFLNVSNSWIPDIREHCPDTPIILVSTRIDLRSHSIYFSPFHAPPPFPSPLPTTSNSIFISQGISIFWERRGFHQRGAHAGSKVEIARILWSFCEEKPWSHKLYERGRK